jgi:hypothetical protein
VVNLLDELSRKRLPHRDRLLHSFLELKQELGRIPTYLELHLHGRANSWEYRNEFGSYIGFLHWVGLLTESENEVYYRYEAWLRDVEKTVMSKSYKMVVLLYMLERGEMNWTEPITPNNAAHFFHSFLMEKEYRKRIDFSDKESQRLWEYNETKVSQLISRMPMKMWGLAKGSMTTFENGLFSLNFDVSPEDRGTLYRWTKEVCLYRLHLHFERRDRNTKGKAHN